jgi:hypothetical protein
MPQSANERRIPFRNRLKPDECIAAIKAHAGQLSLAAEALGVSRGSVEQMVRRYPRVAKAAQDAEERMTDIAAVQMHKLVLKGNYQACAYWLDRSATARARGWGSPGTQVNLGGQAQLIVQNVTITPVEHNKFLDDVADGSLTIEGSLEGAGTDTGEP